MRLLAVSLVAVASAAVAAVAAPAHADDVLVPTCGNLAFGGSIAPTEWSAGCTAGSVNLEGLSWSDWGSAVATATGSIAYDDCDPDCATGQVRVYPAQLRLERIRRCASALGARSYYTRATVLSTVPPEEGGQPPGSSDPFSFTVDCPSPGYTVGVGKRHARLGAFVDDGEFDASRIELLFGKPATVRLVSQSLCRKRWPELGMTAEFVVFGTAEDPCDAGSFLSAVLTTGRWRMPNGVHPGGSARHAARSSSRHCTRRSCGTPGYGFALHRSECSGGRYPAVIAQTGGGRVRRLVVSARWCE